MSFRPSFGWGYARDRFLTFKYVDGGMLIAHDDIIAQKNTQVIT